MSGQTVPNNRAVFLVHGRDLGARNNLVELLEAFDLKVVKWRDAATRVGRATPYTGDIVMAGMRMASAVVVLLTPDDVGYVRTAFRQARDDRHELAPTGQARLNVIFEAGIAMGIDKDRVVMVEMGEVRSLSDTAGLNPIRLRQDVDSRRDLAARLSVAGLAVDLDGEKWRTVGNFNREPLAETDLALPDHDPQGSPPGLVSEDERRVLKALASLFAETGGARVDVPFTVQGLKWPQVATVLRDLANADPPFIEGDAVDQFDYPVAIARLTKTGRAAVGAAGG